MASTCGDITQVMDETAVETAAPEAEELPENHPGVDDGHVDDAGERIVYEYGEDGALVGWHKEPAE